MDPSHLLKDLRLNKIRNIIIYASFIILVISLIFPLINIENLIVQKISLAFFIYGLFLWGTEYLFYALMELAGNDEVGQMVIALSWVASTIFGFLVAFKQSFSISFISLFNS